MKTKIAIALAVLLVLIGFIGWNVWQAVYEPVTTTPGLVEQGHDRLSEQLEKAKAREGEIERQDWGSISQLRELIQAHQHRIDQLNGNSQAGEIVAHDRDAVARIEKRIADLQAQQAAQAATEAARDSDAPPQQQAPKSARSSEPIGTAKATP